MPKKNTRGCDWRLHASINTKNGLWQIKTYEKKHRCNNETPNKDHKQLTSAIVGGLIIDIVRADLDVKPVTIIEAVKLKAQYTISYWKAWQAKQHAFRFLFGAGKRLIICFRN